MYSYRAMSIKKMENTVKELVRFVLLHMIALLHQQHIYA